MSGVFDTSTPVGTEAISNGDDRIREFKVAVQYALQAQTTEGLEAIFPGSAPLTAPVFRYRGLIGTTAARPTAGQYGLYINTTLNALQRDNGSSWVDIATLIPSGTKMPFYQASPPVGWTAVAVNDKFMRVVTSGGTGGTNGGSGSTPGSGASMAHTHSLADSEGNVASQNVGGLWGARYISGGSVPNGGTTRLQIPDGTAGSHLINALQYTTDSALTTLAFTYADFCVGQKD